jgi:hypothetical protein
MMATDGAIDQDDTAARNARFPLTNAVSQLLTVIGFMQVMGT